MRTKLIIGVLLAVILLGVGSYFYYYYFVKTLRLTEIVGHTDNEIVNFIVELGDFDTGLTRHDLSNLKSKQSYWANRINEVLNISDTEQQIEANAKLIAEMMDDPAMSKIVKIITVKGLGFAGKMFEMMN